MSVHDPANARPESFSYSYIGREGHGALHIALSVLVLGLSIGIIAGPSGDTQAGIHTPVESVVADALEKHIETPPALEAPVPTILASVTPSADPLPDPEKKKNLKVRRTSQAAVARP